MSDQLERVQADFQLQLHEDNHGVVQALFPLLLGLEEYLGGVADHRQELGVKGGQVGEILSVLAVGLELEEEQEQAKGGRQMLQVRLALGFVLQRPVLLLACLRAIAQIRTL